MGTHPNDDNINEIKKYFTSVIDWIDRTFKTVDSSMGGLNGDDFMKNIKEFLTM